MVHRNHVFVHLYTFGLEQSAGLGIGAGTRWWLETECIFAGLVGGTSVGQSASGGRGDLA